MRLKLIACQVLTREISRLAAKCPHSLDITYIKQGYHNEPKKLNAILQEEIDRVEQAEQNTAVRYEGYDAILICYGLCSNGIAHIKTTKTPLIIPRAHDCITLYLGSKQRYGDYFAAHPGTYWYTRSWMENTPMPGEGYYDYHYKQYAELYDEDNAEFLAQESMKWLDEYSRAAFIAMPGIPNAAFAKEAQKSAKYLGWEYDFMQGDDSLLRRFLWGNWAQDEFLILAPGEAVAPSYDDMIIKAEE